MLSKLRSWQLLGKNEFRDFKNFGCYVTAHQILVARNNLVQMASAPSNLSSRVLRQLCGQY